MTSPAVAKGAGSKVIGTHIPVMLTEMLATLRPRDGAVYLDGTFGGGGYARAILGHANCCVWAIDRDETAIARGAALAAEYPGRLHLLHGCFGDMLSLLTKAGLINRAPEAGGHALDGIVLDIGVSSFQIDDPARGFSFMADGPLDMRMGRHGIEGKDGELTAAVMVNTLPEHELANILFQLGEERASRRVARAIVVARAEAPIETTGRLASIIRAVLPPDKSGHHPATRSFQALRLRVNDELGEIERGLAQAALLLNPGGRVVVISFHSLEDRIVKRFMTEISGRAPAPSRHDPRGLTQGSVGAARFRLVTTKALRPGTAEIAANPRARSARLRAIERLEVAA
jgi:16S rRNA (cytosine1402-N4)-methyltransferase